MMLSVGYTAADPGKVVDLIAGQYDDVGDVEIWNDGVNLYVKYIVSKFGVYLTETHVHVGESLDDFPLTKKGSPKIGKFDYSMDHDYETEFTYTIPLGNWGPDILVAAHAVVKSMPSGGGLCPTLPDQVEVDLTLRLTPSYFLTVISGGTNLDGTYDGWCIDIHHLFEDGTHDVICSYEDPLPTGLVLYPDNFDLVNYILNQDYSLEPYTPNDIQCAIWILLEGELPTLGGGPPEHTLANVDAIIADAEANGEGYIPGCDEYIVIILKPVNPSKQLSIIKVPRPCDYDETAWGDGTNFSATRVGNGRGDWSMYIPYTVEAMD